MQYTNVQCHMQLNKQCNLQTNIDTVIALQYNM